MPDSRSGDPGSKASTRADSPGRSTRPTSQKQIIIVTGTPGVGKTILAKPLAERTNSVYLSLGELVKKERLYRRYDRASKAFEIDERRLHKRLIEYFARNKAKGIVIETHSLGPFLPRRPQMVALILRLDPVVLARRLRARRWPRRKIWENVEAELVDVSLYQAVRCLGKARVHEIDTTSMSPSPLLAKAMKLISSRKGPAGRSVDWLSKYDPLDLSRRIL